MSYKRPALAILKLFTILFCVLLFHLNPTLETVASPAIIAPGAADSMTTEQLAVVGEIIIFGRVGGFKARSTDGKGQCPLCHTFGPNDISDRAPNLFGITRRSAERIKDPRYLKPDTVQIEAFKGSGRATTAEEYMAESHICPSCFVVAGHGVKGTNDRESAMPAINKPPISLTIEEQVAVDTWLFINDGEKPPPPKVIRAAHEKFIPEAERARERLSEIAPPGPMVPTIALTTDTLEQIIMKMGCFACHQIPTIALAKRGPIGPLLVEKMSTPKRLASPEYQAMVKAGKAHAKTPKEYVIESIVCPDCFVAPAFAQKAVPGKSDMLQDYAMKFTFGALDKLADFLLTLDCDAAKMDNLTGPPQEPFSKVCGE